MLFFVATSMATAATRATPFMMYWYAMSTELRLSPLSRLAMMRAPRIAPEILPLPPMRLHPPITQAAIAFSSMSCPVVEAEEANRDVMTIPATAARKPMIMKTARRFLRTLIPERRAASRLPPMA